MAAPNNLYPQPSLEGGGYKPSSAGQAPIVNSVDGAPGQHNLPALNRANIAAVTGANTPVVSDGVDWIGMSRQAFDSSETWLTINQRHIWAKSFAHYRSEHAPDSPINSPVNKHRARYFWPKTRTLVRSIQAAAASAYFASSDVIAIEAENQDDPLAVEGAELIKGVVNYRMSSTIPWYQTVLGAIQETAVAGTTISHQSWEYVTTTRKTGTLVKDGVSFDVREKIIVKDTPKIRIVPVENLRISPASDWIDPIQSSPYVIEMIPMFLGDVLAKIKKGADEKTLEPPWLDVGANTLISAGNINTLDTTRRARAGKKRQDPRNNMTETIDVFRVVWVHRNIIRYEGVDYLYYTAGPNVLLSIPVPLADVIPWADGERDYVIGKMEVEADRSYPTSPVEMVSEIQRALNEIKNQRVDNVRQVLNRRYLYRAGTSIDIRALGRNVPGGLISVSGSLSDSVKQLEAQDVTASSYNEEDRINLAFDDVSGGMSGSTVQANRKLNETVGGMTMMQDSANLIREMELRTFTETWIEPVLRQVVKLIKAYETDETILTVAAQKISMEEVRLDHFAKRITVSVDVGMGATNPTQRLQKLVGAIAAVVQYVPDAGYALKGEDVSKAIMSVAGYDNGLRFFDFAMGDQKKQQQESQGDPRVKVVQMQLEAKQAADADKMSIEQAKLSLKERELELENLRLAIARAEAQANVDHRTAQAMLIEAQRENTKAMTVNSGVTAVYQATQAAGVAAQNASIAPITDAILRSVGFEDKDAPPVVPPMQSTAPLAIPAPSGTHPNVPAQPVSPGRGILRGIETPTISR